MGISTRKLFLLFAIILSFTVAQSGWTRMESNDGPYAVSRTVAYTSGGRLAINCEPLTPADAAHGRIRDLAAVIPL